MPRSFDIVDDFQVERVRLASTQVAEAVTLAFPNEGITLSLGRYSNGDQEQVIGPFVDDCIPAIDVAGRGQFELQACERTL